MRIIVVILSAWSCQLDENHIFPITYPCFFNMFSEGANREIHSIFHHIDIHDDFGIILLTAQYDTIGAVTVKPFWHKQSMKKPRLKKAGLIIIFLESFLKI